MVGVRRAVIALLVLGLIAAGAAGWWLFTAGADERADADEATCAETVDGDTTPPEAGLLVCRYDVDGGLDRSAVLTAGDSESVDADLEAGAVADPACVAADPTPPIALLVSSAHRAVLALDQVCPTYVLDGGEPRRLTPEVRAWAQVDLA